MWPPPASRTTPLFRFTQAAVALLVISAMAALTVSGWFFRRVAQGHTTVNW